MRNNEVALRIGVTNIFQRVGNRGIHEPHRTATDKIFCFDERKFGLDPGRRAIHHECDRSRGRDHGHLRISDAVFFPQKDRVIPCFLGGSIDCGVTHPVFAHAIQFSAMHGEYAKLGFFVYGVARIRAHTFCNLRGITVRLAGHQRRNRGRGVARLVGIIRKTPGHQKRAQIRVSEPELTVVPGVFPDFFRRIARAPDQNLLCKDDNVNCVYKITDIERTVGI